MSPKGADRMAKSVDPDQTHFDLDPTLFAQVYLYENLGLLWYSMVKPLGQKYRIIT